MDLVPFDAHLDALLLARRCSALGARIKTIMLITGLSRHHVECYFTGIGPKGRVRGSASSWLAPRRAAESSIFAVIFERIFSVQGCDIRIAIVTAYELFKALGCERGAPEDGLAFDTAFSMICDLKGVFTRTVPKLELRHCPRCRALCLWHVGAIDPKGVGCAFCPLARGCMGKNRLPAIPTFADDPSPPGDPVTRARINHRFEFVASFDRTHGSSDGEQ